MICGNRVERVLLDLVVEWLDLLLHRTWGLGRSSQVYVLLDSADVLENFGFLLHVFYLFNMRCSVLCQDVLLANVRTPDEMAWGMRRSALLLSSSHDITQAVRWCSPIKQAADRCCVDDWNF